MNKRMFLFYACVFLLNINISAQVIKYSDLETATKRGEKFTSYVSKDGIEFKIGDTLTIGSPSSNKTFAFIYQGDGIMYPMTQLSIAAAGSKTQILKIMVGGSKRTGFKVGFKTDAGTPFASLNYTIYVENALASGELSSSLMTSDEALAKLKKAKDKLDLDLISNDEYEKIKSELKKYIK